MHLICWKSGSRIGFRLLPSVGFGDVVQIHWTPKISIRKLVTVFLVEAWVPTLELLAPCFQAYEGFSKSLGNMVTKAKLKDTHIFSLTRLRHTRLQGLHFSGAVSYTWQSILSTHKQVCSLALCISFWEGPAPYENWFQQIFLTTERIAKSPTVPSQAWNVRWMVSELQLALLHKLVSFESTMAGCFVVMEVDLPQVKGCGLSFLRFFTTDFMAVSV